VNITKHLIKIKNVFCSRVEHSNAVSIATINATILSIFIALASGYILHFSSIIKQLEMEAIRQAERINDIPFSDTWSKFATVTIDYLKNAKPSDNDMEIRFTQLMVDPMADIQTPDSIKNYQQQTGMTRIEETICLMAAFSLRSPFPERLGTTEYLPEKLATAEHQKKQYFLSPTAKKHFNGVDEVQSWIDEAEKKLSSVLMFIRFFGESRFIHAQKWPQNDILFLNMPSGHFGLKGGVMVTPDVKSLPHEFVKNLQSLYDISHSARVSLNDLKRYSGVMPDKTTKLIFLIFSVFAFYFGVIIPLLTKSVSKLCVIWVPTFFYTSLFVYIFYRVLSP
jgi:hypothetical protein